MTRRKRDRFNGCTGEKISEARRLAVRARLDAGDSELRVAREEGLNRSTVRAIHFSDRYDREKVSYVTAGLAAGFKITANMALEEITAEKLRASSAAQLATVAGIATDKALAIEGKGAGVSIAINILPELLEEAKRRQKIIDAEIRDAEIIKPGTLLNEGAK